MNLLGRALLVDALAVGGPDWLTAAARLSGFEEKPEEEIAVKASPKPSVTGAATVLRRGKKNAAPEAETIPFWRVVKCEYNQEVLSGKAREERVVPDVIWATGSAPDPIRITKWSRLLPHLRRAAMSDVLGTRLDIDKIVDRLSERKLLLRLPRRSWPAWETQIHIVFDRSDRLTPYWDDQEWFASQFVRLLPAATYKVALYWEGMKKPVFAEERHGDYKIPASGGLVLVLGDLGRLAPDSSVRRVWQRFGKHLASNGCRAAALFPRGQNAVLRKPDPPWKTVVWERRAGGSLLRMPSLEEMGSFRENPVVSRLLVLLSPAIRIEPGLLRMVRRWQNMDATVESLFWQHPDVSSASSVAATLNPERVKIYREQFDKLPKNERLEALTRIRQWRANLPKEIWFEECALNPGVLGGIRINEIGRSK
ncbi:MAG: hypothetical protein GY862_08310 [Gammaproteobacteria bacterium]|nr:hypothetical protein [Gammaproteobacteria bacterium]